MSEPPPGEITRILAGAAGLSREEALERLVPLVYDELRVIARSRLGGERPDHSFQTTDLVHEAWMKLAGDRNAPWNDRGHFFRAAAEAMRRVLIDHARTRARVKRGGGGSGGPPRDGPRHLARPRHHPGPRRGDPSPCGTGTPHG
jgi:RNA polymerase sigma factor (TIGR02999 family)